MYNKDIDLFDSLYFREPAICRRNKISLEELQAKIDLLKEDYDEDESVWGNKYSNLTFWEDEPERAGDDKNDEDIDNWKEENIEVK